LEIIRQAAREKILFLPHAVRQMAKPDRMISVDEVRYVVEIGEIIEDYPEDERGHSYLLFGKGEDGRAIHVVCTPKENYLAIITTYLPNPKQWTDSFRKRRK
jgi:hypothetical protein